MPIVRVTFYEGRTDEKKRELAEAITEAMGRIAGSKPEAVHVTFEDVAKRDWFIGAGVPRGAAEAAGAKRS
jgi:4-oxalocrotonate tautomerase